MRNTTFWRCKNIGADQLLGNSAVFIAIYSQGPKVIPQDPFSKDTKFLNIYKKLKCQFSNDVKSYLKIWGRLFKINYDVT